jgi:hypothetical protein
MIVATKVDEHNMKTDAECAFCNEKFDDHGRWDKFFTTQGTDEQAWGFLVCSCCRQDACIHNLISLLEDRIYFKCSNPDSILYSIDCHSQYNY